MKNLKHRAYQCPVCKNEKMIETNHSGSIYTECKKCGSSGMYCLEKESNCFDFDSSAHMTTYKFDISITEDLILYKELMNYMESLEYKNFDTYIDTRLNYFRKYFKDGKVLIREVVCFDSQYITDIGRLHNWQEFIVPNKNIKMGYYLDAFKDDT